MVRRFRSTFGTVLVLSGLALLAVAAGGYATEAFASAESGLIGAVGLVLAGVGANVLRQAGVV